MHRFLRWREASWGSRLWRSGERGSAPSQAPTKAEIRAANEIYGAADGFLQTLSDHQHDRQVCAMHQCGGSWYVVAVHLPEPSHRFRHAMVRFLTDLVARLG